MSRRYSIADARASLPAIVDQAESGASIELTRRGRAVAVVVSLREFERLRGEQARFGDVYGKFLKKYPLREIGLKEDFFESVRGVEAGRKVEL